MESNYVMIEGESIDENLTYVNKYYNMNLKKGQKVMANGKFGIVLGGTNYVWIKRENASLECYHPQDIKPITKEKKT